MRTIMKYMVLAILGLQLPSYCSKPKTTGSAKTESKVSAAQNLGIGLITGATAMGVYLPFNYGQNQRIRGRTMGWNPMKWQPSTWTPKIWWAGLPAAMCSVGMQTAIQIAGYDASASLVEQSTHEKATLVQKTTIAATWGAATGVIASAAELRAAQLQLANKNQNMTRQSLMESIRALPRGPRSLLRGAGPVCIRDGLFTAGNLPLSEKAKEVVKQTTKSDVAAGLVGPAVTGAVVAIATQPTNVARTKLQDDLKAERYKTSLDVYREVIQTQGAKALWKGGAWRATGVATALTAMNAVKDLATRTLQTQRSTSNAKDS